MAVASRTTAIPALYRLVFLWLEPISILAGAVYAHFYQSDYLHLTHAASSGGPRHPVPLSTSIAMTQLANLYLGVAILEASVLRATSDVKVWRVFLVGLLLADLGHLYSVWPVGNHIFYQYWSWNAIDWGNVPWVYFLAITRTMMLLGVGFPQDKVRLKST